MEKQQGLVSVIIPVFNVHPYLTEALDSVLNQTYYKMEIIIIDDGSSDGSGEICDEYAKKDNRIKVVHQENRGLSSARNIGLDIMTGNLVAFLDPDDVLHPCFVEDMLLTLQRENADLAVCNYSVFYSLGSMEKTDSGNRNRLLAKPGLYNRTQILHILVEHRLNYSVWNKLYRRKLWNGIRFPVGHVYEDIDTTFKVLYHTRKTVVLDETLYLYRKRRGSIANTRTPNNTRDWFLAMSHLESFVTKKTPQVFSNEQLKTFRYSLFEKAIKTYVDFYGRSDLEWETFTNEIREQIVQEWEKKTNISIRMRTCYMMMRYCPWLLRIIYPKYVRLKKMVRNLRFV